MRRETSKRGGNSGKVVKQEKENKSKFHPYEQRTFLWCSSYLVINRGISNETEAKFASFVYIGITIGRFYADL